MYIYLYTQKRGDTLTEFDRKFQITREKRFQEPKKHLQTFGNRNFEQN